MTVDAFLAALHAEHFAGTDGQYMVPAIHTFASLQAVAPGHDFDPKPKGHQVEFTVTLDDGRVVLIGTPREDGTFEQFFALKL